MQIMEYFACFYIETYALAAQWLHCVWTIRNFSFYKSERNISLREKSQNMP